MHLFIILCKVTQLVAESHPLQEILKGDIQLLNAKNTATIEEHVFCLFHEHFPQYL